MYYCPVNGWDCSYFRKDGTCKLENPAEECDDFATFEDFFSDLPDEEIVDKILRSYKSPFISSWAPGEPLPEEECFEPGRPVNDIMALNP